MSTLSKIRELLEAIKFSHSIFAFPFALMAALLARRGSLPTMHETLAICGAMVGARTWAMGVNRIADAKIDAQNPRTCNRALPEGRLSMLSLKILSCTGALMLVICAYFLSELAFYLSLPLLIFLALYSFSKRFTYFCHFWLGICLGIAPIGAWIALGNEFNNNILLLGLAVMFWVAGFDILYSLQDMDFDRNQRLCSIPARFGMYKALTIARILHVLSAALFLLVGICFNIGLIYLVGWALTTLFMFYEHWLLRHGNLSKIQVAFFNLNGWISVLLFISAALSLIVIR